MSGQLKIERVPVEQIIDLRWKVLRAGLKRSTAIFGGDELPTTRHFAALRDGKVIACATLLLSPWQDKPAWQLRGMAVDAGLQRQGVGRALLEEIERSVREESDLPMMWCNARETAVGFYRGMGWEIVGERFDIPTAGPHFKMTKRLTDFRRRRAAC